MDKAILQKIIDTHAPGPSFNEQVIQLFEFVRDIPYGSIGSRDPEDVYRQNKGTCSGKHALLKELYRSIGIEVKDYLAKHTYEPILEALENYIALKDNLPDAMGFHNFIKIKRGTNWVTVDAVWDSQLEPLGFTIVKNWDGFTDMPIAIPYIEVYKVEDFIKEKEKLLAELSPQDQANRKHIQNYLNEVISAYRNTHALQ